MANLPVPAPRTFTVSEVETGAYFNALRDALNFLLNPPAATLVQVTTVTPLPSSSPGSGTSVVIGMDSSTFDNYGGHSNSVNNSRYTVQAAGKYLVGGTVAIALNASGARNAKIWKNGNPVQGPYVLSAPSGSRPTSIPVAGFIIPCVVGDYLELAGFQDCGSNLNTTISTDQTSFLTVSRISS